MLWKRVLVALLAFAAMFAPIYYRNLELQNYVSEVAQRVENRTNSDDVLRTWVLDKAHELDLPVTADNVSGNVVLQFSTAPQGDVSGKSISGDIELTMTERMPVAADLISHSGHIECAVEGFVSTVKQANRIEGTIDGGTNKLSLHSGSDKLSMYASLARATSGCFHVKTAGTSYLEALRVVARKAPQFFAEIVEFCRGRFDTDRKSYHISTSAAQVGALPKFSGPKEEAVFLDEVAGRQLLHVTFGSVLTNPGLKPRIMEALERHAALHEELLDRHFTKHLSLLMKG